VLRGGKEAMLASIHGFVVNPLSNVSLGAGGKESCGAAKKLN
jgi:hypothetical protein